MWNWTIGLLTALLGLYLGAAPANGTLQANMALDKPCTLNLKPSYNVEQSKPSDLTDGIIPKPQGARVGWVLPGMVGWQDWSRKSKTIQITVDLGEVRPIGGAALMSSGGGGIVSLPESILVQTSEDGKTFLTAGDLVELDANAPIPVHGSLAYHTFITHDLHTKSRYVRFMCVIPQNVFSCGEVEVFKGEDALLNQPMRGKEMTEDDAVAPLRLTQLGVRRRVLQDVQLVREEMKKAGSVPAGAAAELDGIEKEAREQAYPRKLEGFEAQWPVNELDRKIFAVRGTWLASRGLAAMTLWRTPPYEPLDLSAQPPAAADAANEQITLRMMGNEHRARSFNLTNASGQAVNARFQLADLPDGGKGVKVYEVQWLDTRYGRPRDMALKPIQAHDGWYEAAIPAGFTREIWLSLNSRDTKAGTYNAHIEVKSGQWTKRMPLELSVAAIRFPDRPDFTLSMWDYIFDKSRRVTTENQSAVKQLFLDGYGEMPWMLSLQAGKIAHFDRDGNLTGKVDYSQWDAYVKYWPNMPHLGAYFTTLPPFALDKPQLKRAVASFAADWAKHNRELGLKPGQVVVAFGDEPHTDTQFKRYAILTEAFKEGTQDILVHMNPTPRTLDKLSQFEPAMKLVDIIMPPRLTLDHAWKHPLGEVYQSLARQGKTFWVYSCWGGKDFPPAYYRLQPWTLFAQFGTDGNGEAFWSLGDSAVANNWNDYTAHGRVDYAPLYLAADRVATSKLWEATREGVEDWQYLKMLADAGQLKEARKIAGDCYEQLRKTYGAFFYGLNGASNTASEFAERGRLEALDLLSNSSGRISASRNP